MKESAIVRLRKGIKANSVSLYTLQEDFIMAENILIVFRRMKRAQQVSYTIKYGHVQNKANYR